MAGSNGLYSEQVEAFDRDLAAILAAELPEELAVPHRIFVASGRVRGSDREKGSS